MLKIPDYFSVCDVRKPPKVFVDDKLSEILDGVFIARRRVEKFMNRRELIAYDRILLSLL
jgi:hypothetical protein